MIFCLINKIAYINYWDKDVNLTDREQERMKPRLGET